MAYRAVNLDKLKLQKKEYFKQYYDPAKARVERRKRSKAHAEYCRQPEYREWKKVYDRQYRAKQVYGEFWESFLLAQDIREKVLSSMSAYEVSLSKGVLNKVQKRRLKNDKVNS